MIAVSTRLKRCGWTKSVRTTLKPWGNHCLLVFNYIGNQIIPGLYCLVLFGVVCWYCLLETIILGFLGWCEMDFATIHSMTRSLRTALHLPLRAVLLSVSRAPSAPGGVQAGDSDHDARSTQRLLAFWRLVVFVAKYSGIVCLGISGWLLVTLLLGC